MKINGITNIEKLFATKNENINKTSVTSYKWSPHNITYSYKHGFLEMSTYKTANDPPRNFLKTGVQKITQCS